MNVPMAARGYYGQRGGIPKHSMCVVTHMRNHTINVMTHMQWRFIRTQEGKFFNAAILAGTTGSIAVLVQRPNPMNPSVKQ